MVIGVKIPNLGFSYSVDIGCSKDVTEEHLSQDAITECRAQRPTEWISLGALKSWPILNLEDLPFRFNIMTRLIPAK